MLKRQKELGADGLMLLPPMRYKADNREVVEYFKAVASATDLPILIYNNPVDYGIHVTLDMFDELINYPTIQAVKESTRDLANVTRMINRFGKRIKNTRWCRYNLSGNFNAGCRWISSRVL